MKKVLLVASVAAAVAFTQKMESVSPVKKAVDPAAMYLSDIKPLMETKCAPCHIPEKGGFKTSFANYDSAAKYIDAMIVRVQLDPSDPKYMPFRSKRPAVSPEELTVMKNWKAALDEKAAAKKPE